MRVKKITNARACLWSGVLSFCASLAMAAEPVLLMCPGAPGLSEAEASEHNQALEQQVLKLIHVTRAAYQDLPLEALQLKAAQRALGDDPASLFFWVRDETRWLPYAGALRGAEGVLLDRAGSSLDRALLLAGLLEEAGHVVRLVKAELDEAGWNSLYNTWSQQAQAQAMVEPGVDLRQIEEIASRQDLPAEALAQAHTEQQKESRQRREQRRAETRRQVNALLALMPPQARGNETEETRVSSHWWVQWQAPEGWRDLDPALPGHRLGERLVSADTAILGMHYPEALPDEDRHWLTIEVRAEQVAQGQLHQHTALRQRLPTASLTGQQLKVETPPLRLPAPQTLIDSASARESLPDSLLTQTQWMPVLRHGGQVLRQQVIHADGSVQDPVSGTMTSFTAQALSDVISGLDALSFEGRPGSDSVSVPEVQVEQPPELSAVILRLQVEAPGRPPEVFERPLMDVLGTSARVRGVTDWQLSDDLRDRRAAALMGSIELLAQTSGLPPEQLAAWRYQAVLGSRKGLLGAAYSLSHNDFSFASDILAEGPARREALDTLAMLRLADSPHLDRIGLTRLNLLGYVNLVDYQQGELQLRQGIDIIDNRIDVMGSEDPQRARLAQGVLDTLLEAELVTGAEANPGAVNTARQFAEDLDQGRDWLWVDSPEALTRLDWQPDDDLLSHLRQTLAAGQVLIMPLALSSHAQPSWWQLDPDRGHLLGFGPDRRGQIIEAVLSLMSSMENAASAVEMVATIWGCVADHPQTDAGCCVARAAGEAYVSKVVGDSLLGAATGYWTQRVGARFAASDTFNLLQTGMNYQSGLVAGEFAERLFTIAECR